MEAVAVAVAVAWEPGCAGPTEQAALIGVVPQGSSKGVHGGLGQQNRMHQ